MTKRCVKIERNYFSFVYFFIHDSNIFNRGTNYKFFKSKLKYLHVLIDQIYKHPLCSQYYCWIGLTLCSYWSNLHTSTF